MARFVVVISGPIGAGKTSLAASLSKRFGGCLVRTRDVLEQEYHVHERAPTRGKLQELGDQLDRETGGLWVAEAALRRAELRPQDMVVVDAVRKSEQIQGLGTSFDSRVRHIHLTAGESVLRHRYQKRQQANQATELPSFEQARANATEAAIDRLGERSDVTINTGLSPPWLTYSRASIAILAWRSSNVARRSVPSLVLATLLIAVILGALLGVPLVVVNHLERTESLVLVYSLLLLIFALIFGVALSTESSERQERRRSPQS